MRSNFYLEQGIENWPLPVARVKHEELNPFIKDGVEMYVLLGYEAPYGGMKSYAALGMLRNALESGVYQKGDGLIEATSGAFGLPLVNFALTGSFGASEVVLVMNNDVPIGKSVAPFLAGASTRFPEGTLSGIATARKLGGGGWKPDGQWKRPENGLLNLDQYANPANSHFYHRFAAPKVFGSVGAIDVLVSPVGTGGTLIGFSKFFRERTDKLLVVGAMCAKGTEVPGVRDLDKMAEITQPWREALDVRIEVEQKLAYLCSAWFHWLMGITPGVSSGLDYFAALRFLAGLKKAQELDSVRNKKGTIRVLIVFHDGFRPYVVDRFLANLLTEWQKPSTAPLPSKFL